MKTKSISVQKSLPYHRQLKKLKYDEKFGLIKNINRTNVELKASFDNIAKRDLSVKLNREGKRKRLEGGRDGWMDE